jgi:hypothetical protein
VLEDGVVGRVDSCALWCMKMDGVEAKRVDRDCFAGTVWRYLQLQHRSY